MGGESIHQPGGWYPWPHGVEVHRLSQGIGAPCDLGERWVEGCCGMCSAPSSKGVPWNYRRCSSPTIWLFTSLVSGSRLPWNAVHQQSTLANDGKASIFGDELCKHLCRTRRSSRIKSSVFETTKKKLLANCMSLLTVEVHKYLGCLYWLLSPIISLWYSSFVLHRS